MTQTPALSKKEYYDTLPRKRNAVGVLIITDEKILVLKPTYRESWLVPGGAVEKGESLFAAAERECQEEIGFIPKITRLLVVDYKAGDADTGDAIHFLFEATMNESQIIKIAPEEIERFDWIAKEEALKILGSHLSLRTAAGYEAIKRNATVYCNEGKIIC